MSEIDVTKCRFYLDDGSCCSHDTDCTKCIHCYCDWKVHQEQLHRYKQAIEEIKEIYITTNFKYIAPYADKIGQIIHKCEEVNNDK